MKIYKIRKKGTELYSSGSLYPKYNKYGKCWNSIKNVKLHLAMLEKAPANVEVVEYDLIQSKIISIKDLI